MVGRRAKTKHVELVRGRQLIRHAFTPTALLEQCLAALWLFCQFGGAGAKARKGFGSFATPAQLNEWSLARAERVAQEFRDRWQNAGLPFASGKTGTACLQAAQFIEQPTPWTNPWTAINQLGDWMQEYAQAPPDTKHGKHCPGKIALGLPRNIHGPRPTPLNRQDPAKHQPPLPLRGPRGTRHASPICYHFARDNNRKLLFRAAVFTTDSLWDATRPEAIARAEADAVLTSLVAHLKQRLAKLPSGSATDGGSAVANPDWETLAATYLKRISGTAHLVQLPDGSKSRVELGTPPNPIPKEKEPAIVYRKRSDPRQCRWDPPKSG